jgi:amino acid adenylation domain-containing protein
MLADAHVPVLLTQEALMDRLPAHDAQVVRLDADWPAIAAEPTTAPPSGVHPDNLAYVIYTSGSTGRPKGTLITHGCVSRLFAANEAQFGFGPADVWTLFHSYAFDFSVWEIWGALLYGGRLVVVPYWVSRSPAEFHALLAREGVTVLNQTPSAFAQLMQADAAAPRELALRVVIFGGEALNFAELGGWLERHGAERPQLVNMYGITETTVHVTYRPVRRADVTEGGGSAIGRPLSDLQVYVLDRHMEPAPVGVVGEMYVGGAGLGRGYLGRAGLTAERFVPSPFGDGRRLYRSGDLARWRADGELEYLGRADTQVKLRGFRIELGEIEAALLGQAEIRQAAVMARHDGGGDKRLVAYVVPAAGATPDVNELRTRLKARLPDYMVPQAFVVLEQLPLTPNGKLDRRALPAPEASPAGHDYVAPRNEVEATLARIFAEVLGRQRVGINDNFFELGGDSIRATRAITRVQQEFHLSIPLRTLFESPRAAELADRIETLSWLTTAPAADHDVSLEQGVL